MTDPWIVLGTIGIVGTFALGLFALVAKTSLLKVLLGLQVMGKAATLTFVLAGFLLDDLGRAQSLVFTIVVIEVVVAALALALMVRVYQLTGSIDVRGIRRLRG